MLETNSFGDGGLLPLPPNSGLPEFGIENVVEVGNIRLRLGGVG